MHTQIDQNYKIEELDTIDSTNAYLLRKIESSINNLPHKTVCVAAQQLSGKGKYDRPWISPPGNLYFSIYWLLETDLTKLYGLSVVIGIAVARVMQSYGINDLKLKWPNDIIWHNRKLGGILIQTKNNQGKIGVVIGVGVNLINMQEYSQQINQPVVGLQEILPTTILPQELLQQILRGIDLAMQDFTKYGFDYFKDEWHKYAVNTHV